MRLRGVRFGGNVNNGTNAGWYWNCNNTVGNANWNFGATILSLLFIEG